MDRLMALVTREDGRTDDRPHEAKEGHRAWQ